MDIKTEAPELLPFLDEELRLTAIPTKHKKCFLQYTILQQKSNRKKNIPSRI